MSKLLIKGGRLLDPKNKVDQELDLLTEQGRVVEVGKGLAVDQDTEILDAAGKGSRADGKSKKK